MEITLNNAAIEILSVYVAWQKEIEWLQQNENGDRISAEHAQNAVRLYGALHETLRKWRAIYANNVQRREISGANQT